MQSGAIRRLHVITTKNNVITGNDILTRASVFQKKLYRVCKNENKIQKYIYHFPKVEVRLKLENHINLLYVILTIA